MHTSEEGGVLLGIVAGVFTKGHRIGGEGLVLADHLAPKG